MFILNSLFDLWGNVGAYKIERIHVDYELAQINAFTKIFGQDVVYGCIVHYIRAMTLYLKTNLPRLHKRYSNESKEIAAWHANRQHGQKPAANLRHWV